MRRRALAALGLSGKEAFELGTQAIRDGDPDVRSLAALVLGVSSAEVARPILMEAMRDKDSRVRRGQPVAPRMLGQDVTSLVSLDDAQRRREVRRLARCRRVRLSLSSLSPRRPSRDSGRDSGGDGFQ